VVRRVGEEVDEAMSPERRAGREALAHGQPGPEGPAPQTFDSKGDQKLIPVQSGA